MNNRTLIIVVFLILVFGGAGWRYNDGNPLHVGGGVGLALLIILLLFVLGVL